MSIRARVVSWLGRKYFAWRSRRGAGGADISMLPDSALFPLKRDRLDPVAEIGERRASEPISRVKLPMGFTVWLVTGHAEAKAVLSKPESFSSDFSNLIGKAGVTAEQDPGGLGFVDPPVHTRLRKLLTPEFTVRRLSRLEPRIEAIVTEQLDRMDKADGPVDMWQEFALPIPSLTICELLGVSYEDRDDFQRLSTARFDLLGGAGSALGAISESLSYLKHIVAKERRDPGDGLLGMLIREHGDEIDDDELAGLADGLLTGGLETTASMLALGSMLLVEDPRTAELMLGDEDSVHRVVEEMLRYLTVVQVAFPRFAKQDVEVAGTRFGKGDVVLVSLSGANRDASIDPGTDGATGGTMERFEPAREPSPHLAFGHGVHRCIGAELARMELRAAYPALLRRFPDMRLAITPEEVAFRQVSIVYGVESLPMLLK